MKMIKKYTIDKHRIDFIDFIDFYNFDTLLLNLKNIDSGNSCI